MAEQEAAIHELTANLDVTSASKKHSDDQLKHSRMKTEALLQQLGHMTKEMRWSVAHPKLMKLEQKLPEEVLGDLVQLFEFGMYCLPSTTVCPQLTLQQTTSSCRSCWRC